MKEIKVISHRGANRYAPQNTMPAFEKAVELGVDGIEVDVHMTKDGEIVICHNYTIDETSNGLGKIADYSLKELEKFDFGSYFSSRFVGTKIPTLEEFLSLIKSSDIEIMNIEIKTPIHGEEGLVQKTFDMVKAYGLFDRLLLSSFDRKLLIEAKEIDENCKTAYLFPTWQRIEGQRILPPLNMILSANPDYIHPADVVCNRVLCDIMRRNNIGINVWTPNTKAGMQKLINIDDVDGLITDEPELAMSLVK
ncbi:MAG TPA: glycerophosphodiester phosphodiesterase [Clostridiales bacterium]|nr:glycerophosphodiester phosphodiesterase [Clostridiales bacterium]